MNFLKYTFVFSIAFIVACTKPPDYSDTPEIEFVSFSNTTLRQGFGTGSDDKTILTISFTDGDGDIGGNDTSSTVFFIDTRDGSDFVEFSAPLIPEQGAGNGISGEMYIDVSTTCCIYPSGESGCDGGEPEVPTNALVYQVYIVDRAGNKSNVIETAPLTILCD